MALPPGVETFVYMIQCGIPAAPTESLLNERFYRNGLVNFLHASGV
jgi:hypothetical protein